MIRDTASETPWQTPTIPVCQLPPNGAAEIPPPNFESVNLNIPPVQVASIRFPFPKLKTRGFIFKAPPVSTEQAGSSKRKTSAKPKVVASQTLTRWRPPRDMVKLEDRLFCMLQPPLENLLHSSTIEFPFQPFTHQFSGVAFLFLRHSAILARMKWVWGKPCKPSLPFDC